MARGSLEDAPSAVVYGAVQSRDIEVRCATRRVRWGAPARHSTPRRRRAAAPHTGLTVCVLAPPVRLVWSLCAPPACAPPWFPRPPARVLLVLAAQAFVAAPGARRSDRRRIMAIASAMTIALAITALAFLVYGNVSLRCCPRCAPRFASLERDCRNRSRARTQHPAFLRLSRALSLTATGPPPTRPMRRAGR